MVSLQIRTRQLGKTEGWWFDDAVCLFMVKFIMERKLMLEITHVSTGIHLTSVKL